MDPVLVVRKPGFWSPVIWKTQNLSSHSKPNSKNQTQFWFDFGSLKLELILKIRPSSGFEILLSEIGTYTKNQIQFWSAFY
jgi:hypothetical protein